MTLYWPDLYFFDAAISTIFGSILEIETNRAIKCFCAARWDSVRQRLTGCKKCEN